MKLIDFLQWEEPKKTTYAGGLTGSPGIWIKRDVYKKHHGYSIIINQAFFRENLPDELAALLKRREDGKGNQIGIAFSIDRQKKLMHVVFDPPKDIPQFQGKLYSTSSGTISLTNKMLGDDIWTLFEMSEKVTKQYFDYELEKEIEGKKVFKLTYDPKSATNTQAFIYHQVNPNKS